MFMVASLRWDTWGLLVGGRQVKYIAFRGGGVEEEGCTKFADKSRGG